VTPPSPPRSRTAWILAAAAAGAIVIAAVASRGPSGARVETARVERRDLVVALLCDGLLEPASGGERTAAEAATVAAILVRDGQRVRRGQELVRLESPELAHAARAARAGALEVSEERARAEAEVGQARREALHRQRTADADRRLLARSAIARSTAEADELAASDAAGRLKAAEARLASLAGEGASRLSISTTSARDLDRRVEALTIRAPADGVVYGLPRKPGERVAAGQVVASVADPAHLSVRARVDEPDLPRVAAGQRLIVTFDGLPDRRWEGRVVSVPTGVREAGGRRVGEVLGEISDARLSLPPNASVNIQIVAGEKASALAIPRAALFREGGRRYVYRLESGRARRRGVSVGLIGLNEVEVTSGLAERDVVLLPGSTPLSDGLRVARSSRS
jgi:HlyD family secretion protein